MSEEQKDARLRQAIAERKEHAECNYDYDDDDGGFTDDDAIDELMDECGHDQYGNCLLAELMDECGQDQYGNCLLAGSEYCDWDCPFS